MSGDSTDRYAAWVRSPAYRAERAAKAGVILHLCGEWLARSRRIADVGSGTGLMKKALEDALHKYIVGFEIDVSFIEERRGVAAADACRLPARDASFDFLILNHLYEHVSDQAGLFREAWRVLRAGGGAYVSAGNRRALLEPHYRLPLLSWLPRGAADRFVRWTRRGEGYRGIRFLTYGPLHRLMAAPGFVVHDLTERALDDLIDEQRGGSWRPAWAVLDRLPAGVRRALLHAASPQWFFLLEKPAAQHGSRTGEGPWEGRRGERRGEVGGQGDGRGKGTA